jgi:hypothetical protein
VSPLGALSIGGTVNVGNLPATQSVSGTVNIGNLPSTQTVSGSVTANPGLPGQPFTAEASGGTPQINIAAGKHLVMQQVSIAVSLTSGFAPFADLEFTSGGVASDLFIPLTYQITSGGNDYYSASTMTAVYVDPSTPVTLFMSSSGGSFATKGFSMSGYEVG